MSNFKEYTALYPDYKSITLTLSEEDYMDGYFKNSVEVEKLEKAQKNIRREFRRAQWSTHQRKVENFIDCKVLKLEAVKEAVKPPEPFTRVFPQIGDAGPCHCKCHRCDIGAHDCGEKICNTKKR